MPTAIQVVLRSMSLCALMPWAAARAADVSWLSPVSGNWSDGTRWSTGTPPAAGDNVFIDVAGNYTVTVDVYTLAIGNMTVGATGSQSIVLGTPMFGPTTITATGTISLNDGGRIAPAGNGAGLTLSGAAAQLTLNGGTIDLSPTYFTIVGGRFQYLSGSIVPSGAQYILSMNHVELYGNDFTNQNYLILYNGSVVNLNMTNAAWVEGGGIVFDGMFRNLPGATLRVATGNSNSAYTFTNPGGLENDGEIVIGSTGNGASTLAVTAGQLINRGMIRTVDSRGFTQIIAAELVNEPTGVVQNLVTALHLDKPGAHHINRGTITGLNRIEQSGVSPMFTQASGQLTLAGGLIVSGDTLEYLGGSITAPGSEYLYLSGPGVHLTGNPFTNQVNLSIASGSVVSLDMTNARWVEGGGNSPVIVFDGMFRNLPGATLRVATGNSNSAYTFTNPGGLENGGEIVIGSDANGVNTLAVTAGPLVNRGVIRDVNSRGFMQTISAELVNEGTINVSHVLTINNGGLNLRPGGSVTGSGGLTLDGATLNGAGGIQPTLSAVNSARISPGNPTGPGIIGVFSFGGNLQLQSSVVVNVDIGGLTPGSQHDQMNVAGSAFVAGQLNASLINGYQPLALHSFTILTTASRTGTFSTVNIAPIVLGGFKAVYGPTTVYIAYCHANCDGSSVAPVLTGNDYLCFMNAYANMLPYANCDGVGGQTANDFQCFTNEYANGCP